MLSYSLLMPLLISVLIVLVALWRGWLTRGGAIAALAVGGVILGFGGVAFLAPLLAFFVTSSLLSKVGNATKRRAERHFDKSSERDAVQVLANGGLPALAALGFGMTGSVGWFIFFLGAMATATADTWATELGTLSRRPPRSIVSGRQVMPGMSGGVSMLGLLASLLGGLLIGGVGYLAGSGLAGSSAFGELLLLGGLSGLAGSLIDSLLGAMLQRHYWDPSGEMLTEKAQIDGQPLALKRGVSWMNNDVVNLLAASGGGLIALLWAL